MESLSDFRLGVEIQSEMMKKGELSKMPEFVVRSWIQSFELLLNYINVVSETDMNAIASDSTVIEHFISINRNPNVLTIRDTVLQISFIILSKMIMMQNKPLLFEPFFNSVQGLVKSTSVRL